MPRREARSVTGSERVGPYTLLRVERGGLDPGVPGQFFMLAPPGRLLPRPMSLCLAPRGELAFLSTRSGPGRARWPRWRRATELTVFGPLGNGFRLDVERPLIVGGGIGVAPFPYVVGSSSAARRPCSDSAPRTTPRRRRSCPAPRSSSSRRYVTEAMPPGRDVLACGPEPMLEAVRALAPGRPARVGGADGLRLRRLLRLRGRDRRRAQAPLRRRARARGGGVIRILNGSAASTRSPRPTSRARSTRS